MSAPARFGPSDRLPGETPGKHVLYLAVFEDCAKIGVTRSPRRRLAQLRKIRADLVCVYLAAYGEWEARDRENIAARMFGGKTGTKGRASEWLAGIDLPAVLRAMTSPLPDPDAYDGAYRSRRLLARTAAELKAA